MVHGRTLTTATRLAETTGSSLSQERAAWSAQTFRPTSPAKIRPLSEQELRCALRVSSTVQVVSNIMIDQYPNSWKSKFLLLSIAIKLRKKSHMPYPIKTYKASPKVRLSRGPLGVIAKETAARVSRHSGVLRGFQENAAGTGATQSTMTVSSKFRGNPAPQIVHQVGTISHFYDFD